MSPEKIPDRMNVVVLDAYTGAETLHVEQRPVPKPGPGQALVKVAASSINPSDLAFLRGSYGVRKPLPVVPGFEGSGTVVAVGRGLMGRYLLGKRVACVSSDAGEGAWAEYMLTTFGLALPLAASVSLEQGAMSVVNPLTAMAFLTIIQDGNHNTIIQTAAASALGQMVDRLCQREGVRVINIVRRPEQVAVLHKQGAIMVLNSSDPGFDQALRQACQLYPPRLAFDAVSGALTMQVLDAMPPHSKVTVYGGLSGEAAQANPGNLIFAGKSIDGFWLTSWLGKKGFLGQLMLWRRAQKLIGTDLKTEIRKQYPLREAQQAVRVYQAQMTGGKVLIVPGR